LFQDAKKGVLFIDFPPVLQLQLKRFEYDFMRDTMVKVSNGNIPQRGFAFTNLGRHYLLQDLITFNNYRIFRYLQNFHSIEKLRMSLKFDCQ